ncbi:CAMSAP CH domain [Parelaphostrongylus tenuis]|uniref:CAMSAP CH domain n=1 Tax=Parelaphostrongylus tenuis TaxID=148309 RepID=A0AAD5RDZ9_PARTN|nr:CAMSAP CH domain [Parelaphostrongylus tenuis]
MPVGSLQTKRLSQLLSHCISNQRLVGKLERLNVHNRDHVLELCRRYHLLLDRLKRHNVEEVSLPIHVDTIVQGVATPSQLSVSSLASSDLVDRPESVQSVCSSIDVTRASASSETYLERAISDLRRRLHSIIQSYNEGPKSISSAKEDYNSILGYLEELNGLFMELAQSDDSKKEAIGNSMIHLQQHLNDIKSKLQMEIEEETSLSKKEQEVILELTRLEQRVTNRDVEDLNLSDELDQLQTQMDLLRMISSRPRHFVESDLMEREMSPSDRSRHKRKVFMMVTNTVTTIIQVVEERILSIKAHSQDPLVQQKLALLKTNLKILEKEVAGAIPEELTATLGKDSHVPHSKLEISPLKWTKTTLNPEEINTNILKIEQALDKAKDFDPKGCHDPDILAKYLDVMKTEEFSLNVLSDIVAEIAMLEDSEYLDRIYALQERYNAVKNSFTDRIAELRAEHTVDNIREIYRPDISSNIPAEKDIDKLADALRSAIESAETIAYDEFAKPDSLLKTRDFLENQEPVLSLLSDAAVEQANVGNADGIDLASSLTEQIRTLKYMIDDRINQSGFEQRRVDVDDEIACSAVDESLRNTLTPISSRLAQLLNDAKRLLSSPDGVPSQYRPSAEVLNNECARAISVLHDAPTNHPSVEALNVALSSAKNIIPILEERVRNWDEFIRVRDEVDAELNKLRQPLDEVRTLQQLSERLDPLESAYEDVRFIDVDIEQTEKQYDDVLNELLTEVEDEKLLCDSVDHFIDEINSICSMLTEQPTKDRLENIDSFQLPALQAELSTLQKKHNEANNTRKHVDADSSRLSVLNDRMSSLGALMKVAEESIEKNEQESLIALLRTKLLQLTTLPFRDLSEESLVDVENQLGSLPSEHADQLRNQIEQLRDMKKKHDDTTKETLERFALVENTIATFPSSYDIESVEANLGRIRNAREALAELSPDVIAEEKIADRVENTRRLIDDLAKRNEDDLQKLSRERDLRNNALESLNQLERDVSHLGNAPPSSMTPSTELITFIQANIPSLLAKLDAITDVPVDLVPKKDDILNRIGTISRMLDDRLNERINYEEKAKKLQDIFNECNDKLRNRSELPIPIEDIIKEVEDLSSLLARLDAIPKKDLASCSELAGDIDNVKERLKVQLSTLQRTLDDEKNAREKQNELRKRILAISDGLRYVDVENPESALKLVDSLDAELQTLRGTADTFHQFAITFSPLASHDDLDKTLPEQFERLQKECDEKRKDVQQLMELSRITPEILQISERLQQQSDEIPHNLSEQQAVLVDLENKKQRLENLLQTIPDGDATEELRQRSTCDLSKLKDLLRKLGDSIADKIAALAAFNAAREDTDDQLLRITSPKATEKTPEELKKDEDTLCRLQQRILELDRSALEDEQQNEHAQLLHRIDKVITAVKQRRADLEDEIARTATEEWLRNTLIPISDRLAQLVKDASRLLLDPEGVPSQYRLSAQELNNECKHAITALHNTPANHPYVEALNLALSSTENIIPVLEERAKNWDEFVRVRDEVDAQLNKLRQPLDEVLTKSRRSVNDSLNNFDTLSSEKQKSSILRDKVRILQELSERLNPLESVYADVRFIDVDVAQTEEQYDDLLNELSTEIEDEKRLCESVDNFINEVNAICSLLTEQPTKDRLENIEQFQLPALRAEVSALQEKYNEANNTRKHVDPDASRLSVLNDRMSSLGALMKGAEESIEKNEKEALFALLTMKLLQLTALPLRELNEELLVDVENQLGSLRMEHANHLRNQIDQLRDMKKKHGDTAKETLERLAVVENAVATLPSSYDIETVEANLGRIRDAREALAELSPEVIAEEKAADRVENTRRSIDDLAKRNEEQLQQLLRERDLRNNAIESLGQLERDVSNLKNALPSSMTSSSELVDYKQANIPILLAKLDAITDVPVDLLPKRDDLSNRIDTISRILDDQLNERIKYEETAKKLRDIVNEYNAKLRNRSEVPIPIEDVVKEVEDLSSLLARINAIPQEDLLLCVDLTGDLDTVKKQVKEQLSTWRRTLSDEENARDKQNELRKRLSTIADDLRNTDIENPENARRLVDLLDAELQKLREISDTCHQFAIGFSPVASHDDLDKTFPQQIEHLLKKCVEKKKDIEQSIELNRVTPEIFQIYESLQQQSDEIPDNLSEQQAVLVDLENKKQRLENLLQTVPVNDATEELRQRSAWGLSKLKDLLRKLGDSIADKIAALAVFNATRQEIEDQLLCITSPEVIVKTPEELRKDEDALCRLQQRIADVDRNALDDGQQNEHAQLVDRIDRMIAAVKNGKETEHIAQNAIASMKFVDILERASFSTKNTLIEFALVNIKFLTTKFASKPDFIMKVSASPL